MSNPEIVVAHGDRRVGNLLVSHLTCEGFDVFRTVSGATAVLRALKRKPVAVICDFTLADHGGLMVTKLLRQKWPNIAELPILFVTRNGFPLRQAARQCGATSFMVVPEDGNLSELVEHIIFFAAA